MSLRTPAVAVLTGALLTTAPLLPAAAAPAATAAPVVAAAPGSLSASPVASATLFTELSPQVWGYRVTPGQWFDIGGAVLQGMRGATWNGYVVDGTYYNAPASTLGLQWSSGASDNRWRLMGSLRTPGTYEFTITRAKYDVNQNTPRNVKISITVVDVPEITQQPVDQTVTVGERATFTVAARSAGPSTVLWQYSDDRGARWWDSEEWSATSWTLTTNQLSLTAKDHQWRAVITSPDGTQTISRTATAVVLKEDHFPSRFPTSQR